jgi:hypothetical protein
MNNSSSLSSSSSSAATSLSSTNSTNAHDKNKNTIDDTVTINGKINLTKKQRHVLKIICDTYEMSFSEYMQQALVEAMRFDIAEGNFSDALLEKIDDKKKDNSSPSSSTSIPPGPTNSNLDLFKKLQTQIS